jgi:hypothetical protein
VNPSLCWVDAWAYDHLLGQAETAWASGHGSRAAGLTEQALALYGGPFLGAEKVGTEASRAFNDRDELWRILAAGRNLAQQGHKGRKVIMKRAARTLLIVIGLSLAAGGIFATDAVASDASLHMVSVYLGVLYAHDYELTITGCSSSVVSFEGTGVYPAGPGPYTFTEVVTGGSLNLGTGVLTFTTSYNETPYLATITGNGPASGPWVGGGFD